MKPIEDLDDFEKWRWAMDFCKAHQLPPAQTRRLGYGRVEGAARLDSQKEAVKSCLLPAMRQYRHGTGEAELIPGFEIYQEIYKQLAECWEEVGLCETLESHAMRIKFDGDRVIRDLALVGRTINQPPMGFDNKPDHGGGSG